MKCMMEKRHIHNAAIPFGTPHKNTYTREILSYIHAHIADSIEAYVWKQQQHATHTHAQFMRLIYSVFRSMPYNIEPCAFFFFFDLRYMYIYLYRCTRERYIYIHIFFRLVCARYFLIVVAASIDTIVFVIG